MSPSPGERNSTGKAESPQHAATGFFDRDDKLRPEIVEGLIREGQLVAFAGKAAAGLDAIPSGAASPGGVESGGNRSGLKI